ncbi:uncharacterized protein LOC135492857 [Lineus longissimus]|uniref:uncharacterized protein LOC135492857 n=1 Tax=Lineus longissimus TaxID=88925 RepID=UPI002B4D64A6
MASWIATWIISVFIVATLIEKGFLLMCYECISVEDPKCADPFDPWRFRAVMCHGTKNKCASQRQNQSGSTDSGQIIAVQRGCYKVGQVPQLNDTDGCREWTHPITAYTATYCFCGTDLCNGAPSINVSRINVYCCILLQALFALAFLWS